MCHSVTSEPDTKELVYELEAFGDASSSAYTAMVYLVIKSRFSSQVQLIASKTRVAPLRKQTIPRLELLAALILVQLTARIKTTVEQCLLISRVRCWTDLTNVLYWIKGKDKEWKQFVNHRVADICLWLTNCLHSLSFPLDPVQLPLIQTTLAD